jgi:hypothetical protein
MPGTDRCWAVITNPLEHHLGIVWASQTPQGITMSDALTENWTTNSHLCENRMVQTGFEKKTKTLRTG